MKRLSVSNYGREPRWRLAHGLRLTGMFEPMASWLFDSASLTKRLKQASRGAFKVRLLNQGLERPLFCERRALGLDDRAVALVRQVHLCCAGEVKVYARSIIPLAVLRGRSRRLAQLGGKPLGEMLFRDKSMCRSPMQIAAVAPGDLFYDWGVPAGTTPAGAVWGRRSVFRLSGGALLVNEIFLPPVPRLLGFRIKHKV